MNIGANGCKFLKISFQFQTAVSSSYPLKSKHTLNSVCGLRISYPHSFSAVRALCIAESNRFMFGVRIARVKTVGSKTIPGFVYINYTAPANKKKDDPLRVHGVRIATLAETQQSAHGV